MSEIIIKNTARLQENMLESIYLLILAISVEKLIQSFWNFII